MFRSACARVAVAAAVAAALIGGGILGHTWP
jgi:hypothetical protein